MELAYATKVNYSLQTNAEMARGITDSISCEAKQRSVATVCLDYTPKSLPCMFLTKLLISLDLGERLLFASTSVSSCCEWNWCSGGCLPVRSRQINKYGERYGC